MSAPASSQTPTSPQFSSISGSSTLPVIRWNAVPGAERYELQVARDGAFTLVVLDDTSIVDTATVAGPLSADTGYYCRVAALAGNDRSAWSATLRFFAENAMSVYALPLVAGWNLVSFPLTLSDSAREFFFPSNCITPTPICYNGSYDCCGNYQSAVTAHLYGFWMRSPAKTVLGVTGQPKLADTLSLANGWNIVGSIFEPIAVTSVMTNPPSILAPRFFGYKNGSYVSADTIAPFAAYWIRTSSSGQMIFPKPKASPAAIIAYIHWERQPLAGMKVVVVETDDTLYTDSSGLAIFKVPAGKYTVRAYGINRGGPVLLSIDFGATVEEGEEVTVDIFDCLPCD